MERQRSSINQAYLLESGAGEHVQTLDFHLGNPLGLVERLLLLIVYNEYFKASCQLFIDLIYSAFTTFKSTHLQ